MTVIPLSSASRFAIAESDASNLLSLPVAPRAVCGLRYVPAAKSGPALTTTEALMAVQRHEGLVGVELLGPGDPLATISGTLDIIQAIRKQHPALSISLTTLGLGGAACAAELAAAGLDRINLLADTLDAAIAAKLYGWIRPGKKNVALAQAVTLLLAEQANIVQAMTRAGVAVFLRTTVYPGFNAHQLANLAETMAALGARGIELLPFSPDPQQTDAPQAATRVHMEQIGKLTSRHLVTRARQVAVDGCGCASEGCGCGCGSETGATVQTGLPRPSAERPRVAVVSATGMEVDLHLGQARTLLIYGPRADGLTCLLETRQAPEAGSGEARWEQLAAILPDCFALLAASAGQRPREELARRGIRVILTEENIEGSVDLLYGGGKKQKCR